MRQMILASIAAYVLAMGASVSASPLSDVIFHDTFNTSGNSNDFNFEIGPPRQLGTIGTIAYSEKAVTGTGGAIPFFTQVGNSGPQGLIAGDQDADPETGYVWVSPNHNFVEEPRFRINLQVAPAASGSNQNDWLGISFGAATQGLFINNSGVFGVLVTGAGGVQVWDGSGLAANTVVPNLFYHDIEIDVYAPAFGSDAVIDLSVDGISILSGYNRTGGFNDNYLTIGGFDSAGDNNLTVHYFDNLVVSVPEPSGILFGCGLVALAGARRRRSS
jgi:hypothetical protein